MTDERDVENECNVMFMQLRDEVVKNAGDPAVLDAVQPVVTTLLLDITRIANALERIAINTQDRPASPRY